MVQAIGEGVKLLKCSDWDIDLADLFHNWNHGSVIRSSLVELMERALRSEHRMEGLEPYIADTGEQRWGVEFALQKSLPIPLLAQAVWGFLRVPRSGAAVGEDRRASAARVRRASPQAGGAGRDAAG